MWHLVSKGSRSDTSPPSHACILFSFNKEPPRDMRLDIVPLLKSPSFSLTLSQIHLHRGGFLSFLHNWNRSKRINHGGDMSGHWSATFVVSLHISILARVFSLSRNALCIVALIIALKTNKKKQLLGRDLWSLHGYSVKQCVCVSVCVCKQLTEWSFRSRDRKEGRLEKAKKKSVEANRSNSVAERWKRATWTVIEMDSPRPTVFDQLCVAICSFCKP